MSTQKENQYKDMVCLYIFTHKITGLKYFGKTTRHFTIESLLKYGGSGSYWKSHKRVHGNDLSVEIYGIFNINEVKEIALKFSEDNNIVKALNESGDRKDKKVWANERPENGFDGVPRGTVFSKKHKEAISKSVTGRKASKETKQLLSNIRKGFKLLQETKDKIGDANRGQKRTEEVRQKCINARLGLKDSETTKKLKSKAQMGHVVTQETKDKISLAQKGVPKDEATKKKMSKAATGRRHSSETKLKMSKLQKGRVNEIITCPYCKKEGGNNVMKRWHFNNCKNRNLSRI